METIKSDNELIAEFDNQMEWYVPNNKNYDPYWRRKGMEVSVKNMKYDRSWDWTIPVCRKLITDLLVLIDWLQKQDAIDGDALHEAKRLKANLYHEIACLDLHRVNQALVEGIKWYNQKSLTS